MRIVFGCFPLLILLVLFLIVSAPFWGLIATMSLFRRAQKDPAAKRQNPYRQPQWKTNSQAEETKIFKADEGEYIDYTEIADEETSPSQTETNSQ